VPLSVTWTLIRGAVVPGGGATVVVGSATSGDGSTADATPIGAAPILAAATVRDTKATTRRLTGTYA
jgi:hypothetical protein